MATKKKYPTVKATNGAVFELRGDEFAQVETSPGGFLKFSATRPAMSNLRDGDEIPVTRTDHGLPNDMWGFTCRLYPSGRFKIGCMAFHGADAAKIRKWAKA